MRLTPIVAALAAILPVAAADWQFSVPAPTIPDRRAFLWVPPECPQVRGLVVAVHNMLERSLFERADFRDALARDGLGELLVFSGHDRAPDDQGTTHPPRSPLDIFLNPDFPQGAEDPAGAGRDLQGVLDALAERSGYAEISRAPLLPVGHSSAGSFVWHLARWDASRIIAMLPFKTGPKDDGPLGIPILEVNSEWFDYGSGTRDCAFSAGAVDARRRARAGGQLFGYTVDIGSGHCNVSDDSIPVVARFIHAAVAARVPQRLPATGPVPLAPVAATSGWLLDPATLGRPGTTPVAATAWTGDPRSAMWYLDRDLATAVQEHVAAQLAKRPQQLGFRQQDGTPSTRPGTFAFSPVFAEDGATFSLEAAFIDHLDQTDLFPAGQRLDTTPLPILYRVVSGALVQVGPRSFRVRPHAGPLVPQGNPWEPTIIAYTLGDATHRPTERPAHVNVAVVNRGGQAQTLEFPAIPDQRVGHLRPLQLVATASSGLPVQFIPVSGPIEIEGTTLRFTAIPRRAAFPIRVLVSAFQWGRTGDHPVASVGPVMTEFLIRE